MTAGQLAVDAGLLDWPSYWPMLIMRTAYERHKANSKTSVGIAQSLICKPADDCNNPNLYLDIDPSTEAHFGADTMGLRYRFCGEDVIAIRDDMLDRLCGDVETRRALNALLVSNSLIRGGQGDRNTTQIKRACWIADKRYDKPRFLLISVEALERWRTS